MGWITMVLGLLAGAVAGGGLTFATMLAREAIVVDGARKVERDKGVQACNVRVGQIEQKLNQAIADQVEAARLAAEAVKDAPADDAGLVALCNADPACRSRRAQP